MKENEVSLREHLDLKINLVLNEIKKSNKKHDETEQRLDKLEKKVWALVIIVTILLNKSDIGEVILKRFM